MIVVQNYHDRLAVSPILLNPESYFDFLWESYNSSWWVFLDDSVVFVINIQSVGRNTFVTHLADWYLCTSILDKVCCAYSPTYNPVTLMKVNQSATTVSGESISDLLPSVFRAANISCVMGLCCLAIFSSFPLPEINIVQIFFRSRKSAGIGKLRRQKGMYELALWVRAYP